MEKKDIIEQLIEARLSKGYSQTDLANLVGTKRENISRIESGKQNISLDMLNKLTSALDMSVTYSLNENTSNIYYLKLYDDVLLSFELYREALEDYKARIIDINMDKKELLPLDLKLNDEGIIKWLQRRIIPKNRYYVDEILESLGLSRNDVKGIIDVCKGLSLNDSYWVVKDDFAGKYENYNLYNNHFSNVLSLVAYTGIYSEKRAITTSPELTTNGMLPKAWRFIDGDGIYLYKGGSIVASNSGREPYMEYYAYQIGKTMGIDVVPYELTRWKGILASKCPLFTDINTSYIPIGRIVETGGLKEVVKYYDSLGKTFHNQIRDMLIFDSVIINEDRHFGNFGILRDNHTGKIIKPAPIFDNGLSLLCYISKDKYSLDYMKEYASKRVSAYNIEFDEIVNEYMEKRQKDKLRKLIGFKFERDKKDNLNEEFLSNLEIIIQERVNHLLKM